MPFLDEDKIIRTHYRQEYKCGRKNLMGNHPQKNWTAGDLDNLIGKIDQIDEVTRKTRRVHKKEQRTGRPVEKFNRSESETNIFYQ